MDSGWLNPAETVGDQDQDEQRNRKSDAECERLHGAIALALVFHQEYESGAKAGEDEGEGDGNQDFHGETGRCRSGSRGKSDIVMRFMFRFRLIPFLAAVLVAAAGTALGQWQTRRAHEKEVIEAAIRERGAAPDVNLNAVPPATGAEFRRAVVQGQFVGSWPIYLDNRPYNEAAGFYVLMPFRIASTDRYVLVARGWVRRDPVDRTKLPAIPVPQGTVQLRGVLRRDVGHVMELGAAGTLKPGAIVQNADAAGVARAAGLKMMPLMLEQANDTQDDLVRDWPLPSAGVERHRGYAFQWYALAATAVLFFVVTGFRRGTS